jgi:hypothetical protein
MSNEEDLTTGIHPFTFAYMDTSEIAEAYAISEHYKMLHDDKGAPSLQDAIILATPGRIKPPKSLSEAHIYFQNFRVALHVLMGSAHELTKTYDTFWLASLEHQPAVSAYCLHSAAGHVSNVSGPLGAVANLLVVRATGHGKRAVGGSQLRGAAQSDSAPHAVGTQSPSALLQHSSRGAGQHAPDDD